MMKVIWQPWGSGAPCLAVFLLSPTETIFHHDGQSHLVWFNIICALGGNQSTVPEFCDLGIHLHYRLG